MVDGAGHDVPGRQFATRVEARHETLAIGQAEQGAFAAQCLGDEETLGLRVVQAGRVELVELQVADPAAGAPGHGDAVAGVAVGIAGIKVDLARAAGGQHAEAGTEGIDFAAFPIQHVGAQAALARQAELALGDQVDRHPLRQQLDVRSPPGLGQQGIEDRGAGGVGGMDDAPVAVPAFAGQVVFEAAFLVVVLLVAGEGHPLFDQPLDRFAAMLHGEAHRVLAAQAATGDQGVLDVGFHGVGIVQHGGHAALGPVSRALRQFALAEDGDAQVFRKGQGQTQAGGAAADDQYIVLIMLAHARISPWWSPSI